MKTPKYIKRIEESLFLDGETKLIALCEIDLLLQGKYIEHGFACDEGNLTGAFIFSSTEQGYEFWVDVARAIGHW